MYGVSQWRRADLRAVFSKLKIGKKERKRNTKKEEEEEEEREEREEREKRSGSGARERAEST